jgi:hypothetical protein
MIQQQASTDEVSPVDKSAGGEKSVTTDVQPKEARMPEEGRR